MKFVVGMRYLKLSSELQLHFTVNTTVIFWIITTYSPVDECQHFAGIYCLHLQGKQYLSWPGFESFSYRIQLEDWYSERVREVRGSIPGRGKRFVCAP
jgi:hypothetical protein